MISKSWSFPILSFIALVVIISTLTRTSSVNAAPPATIAPARLSRDPLSSSVLALMTARFIEGRDDASDQISIQTCTNSTTDFDCFFTQGAFGECKATFDPSSDSTEFHKCLQNLCSSTSGAVIDCLADPTRSISVDKQQALIISSCAESLDGPISTDGRTCLDLNFDNCAFASDPGFRPNGGKFNSCMHSACPEVNAGTINCLSIHFQEFFADCRSGTCQ